MHSIWGLITALILVSACQSQSVDQFDADAFRSVDSQESWSELVETLKEVDLSGVIDKKPIPSFFVKLLLDVLKSSTFPTAVAKGISPQCLNDSKRYVDSLAKAELWALQMHESTADGLPIGTFKNFNSYVYGLFDECLAVRAPESAFRGQYCSVFLRPTLLKRKSDYIHTNQSATSNQPTPVKIINWVTIYELLSRLEIIGRRVKPVVLKPGFYDPYMPGMGFCIPSSCTADDFQQSIAQLVGKKALVGFGYEFAIATATSENHCFTDKEDPPQFDGADIAVLVILSVIAFLVVAATVHEYVRTLISRPIDSKKDGLAVRVLHCFSFSNNRRKLMATAPSAENIGCINGIRVMSTLWVVLGHSFLNFSQMGPNSFVAQKDAKKWSFQIVGNATISVDTFFLISGMLVAYLMLRELDRSKGRFNIILYYVHRYLRLTPVYAIILGFIATLLVYVGSGPNWGNVAFASEHCRKDWWKNLLYVNNFLQTTDDSCMAETWYLANDMQFFLLSPLLVYPLWRWKAYGVIWVVFLTLASLGGIVATYIVDKIPATLIMSRPLDSYLLDPNFMDKYYFMPWCRLPPYLVGILLGYLLHVNKKSQRKLPKYAVVLGWAAAIAIALAVLFGLVGLLDPKEVHKIDDATRVIYGSFHRFAWSIAVAWVIFACVQGQGGLVNDFLSWKAFAPLGRLTYCVYLIHLNYITTFIARSRAAFFYNVTDVVMYYFAFLFTSFGLAFLVSVTVEASFLNLEKLLFSFSAGKPAASKQQSDIAQKSEQMTDLESVKHKN